ncbi:MAG: VWA domain-containing protein [Clostridia bacterium]|nr:VWA domain-containing protein [Clostridia bacterium]
MGVSFNHPWWWLAWPLVALAVYHLRQPWLAAARRAGPESLRRERWRLGLRLLLVTLLLAVLSGPHLVTTVDRQAVIFALDASASVGSERSSAEEWVRQALETKPRDALAGVVAFGRQALVEEPVGTGPSFRRVQTDPGAAATSLGEAMELARALLPLEARRRVILLTDGRDTGGDAPQVARELNRQGIRVDVVPVGREGRDDIRLEAFTLPARARTGETTTVQVCLSSRQAGSVTLYLSRDGEPVGSWEVRLEPGENNLAFPVAVGPAGLRRYRVSLAAPPGQDAFAANNELGAVQQVVGPPRVLVVAPNPGEARPLVAALEATGEVEIQVVGADGVPQDALGLAGYQAVFLVNVPAYALGERTMAAIETYVRDGGGGLVMVGGPDSFGPGGYAGTPVERALPVQMQISGRGEMPSLGLMLVIDKSGSMAEVAGGGEKIGLAKEAAARAVEMLTDRDQAGVLAFDSQPWWLVPLAPVTEKASLKEQIGRLYADGGTEIYPALAGAFEALRRAKVQVKHVILLTDGISASGGPYLDLMAAMRADGITLSTVAVGAGADAGMLQALAELGRGRFYATADAASIPSIFTKETVMATRAYAVNEEFYPRVAAASELVQGLGEVPPLEGYITVSPKDLARTVLVSHRGDPVLAAWQYGLGRAVAWTPDAGGRWSTTWANSQAFPRLWGRVLSWILPAVDASPLRVQAEVTEAASGEAALRIEVDDPGRWQEVRRLEAVVTGPEGSSRRIHLAPAGPGRYAALVEVQPGAYTVTVTGAQEPGVLAQTGVVVSYPEEYRRTGPDPDALAALARAGGGEILTDPAAAFAPNLAPVRARRDLSLLLLALACLVWVLDVAGRRLTLGREELELARRAVGRACGTLFARRVGSRETGPVPAWTRQPRLAVERMRSRVRAQGQGPAAAGKPSLAGDLPARERPRPAAPSKPATGPSGRTGAGTGAAEDAPGHAVSAVLARRRRDKA